MALALGVSAVGASNGATALPTNSVTTQATGSTFILLLSSPTAVLAPTDNKGNTYTLTPQLSFTYNGGSNAGSVWICQNGVGGAGHIFTFNMSSSSAAVGIAIEITSGGAYGVLDQSSTTPNLVGVNTANSPSITPVVNNEVVLSFASGIIASNITITDPSGYNNILQANGNGVTNGNPIGAVGALVQTTAGATSDVFAFSNTVNNAGTATLSFMPSGLSAPIVSSLSSFNLGPG